MGFLSPLTGEKLATISTCGKMRIYDVDNQAKRQRPSVVVVRYEAKQNSYNCRAIWHPKREDLLFIGSNKNPRRIEAISDKGVYYHSLKGEYLNTICQIVTCHPT